MYKHFVNLVTIRISIHDIPFMPKQIIMQSSIRLCSFCNFYHRKVTKLSPVMYYQICNNTMTTNVLSEIPVKKKVKQRTKKCTELIQVLNQRTTNRKATVQKLEASDIAMLVNQPNVVDKSHKSENTKSFCKNDFDPSAVNETGTLTNTNRKLKKFNKEKNTGDGKKVAQTVVDENMVKLKTNKASDKKKKSDQTVNKYMTEQYIQTLLVYMQVYLSCGLLKRTNKTLMLYRKHMQGRLQHCDKCIELYNVVLEAYASKGNFVKVMELYKVIKMDSVKPTPQTYVFILDTLGKIKMGEKQIALLNQLRREMFINNISFNQIFNNSYFKHGQRKTILELIRQILPNFKLPDVKLNVEYTHNVLNKTIMQNNYQSPAVGIITMEELKDCLKAQMQNEAETEVQVESIVKHCENPSVNRYRQKVIGMENYWKETALTVFERNLKCLKEKECQSHNTLMVLHPFLEVLDTKHYIHAIMREIRHIAQGSENYSTPLKLLYINLGNHIHKKYEMQVKEQTGVLDKIVSVYQKYLEWYLHPECFPKLKNLNNRTVWKYLELEEEKHGTSINTVSINWPLEVVTDVGKFLYNIILNDIILKPDMLKGQDVKGSIPAFYTLFRNKGNYLMEQIKPHPFVSKLYKEAQIEILTFNSIFLPSRCPSRPWTSIDCGGFLLTRTDFVRITDQTNVSWNNLQKTPLKQLYPIFDSLNQLSSIPWVINSAILDIVIKVFQDGGSVGLCIPQSTSKLSPPPTINKDATPDEKRSTAIAMAKYKQKRYEMYSLWCDSLYRLSLANYLRDKVFWLPHNLDFRGRVYPVPPHLNHLTADLGRSLLLFGKPKPLGRNGLDWLKLHAINLTNMKKGSSMEERLKFADENIENILDSAEKPLTGKMWWTQSEEPWQTLATCMEISNALKSPNIEEYQSKFPVHQDGSCNGLQHYAALGRDKIGAESVNLYPFKAPNDVYSAVAAIVEKERVKDAENGIKIAKVLEKFVKRKVIKQTVMTSVYGVTKYGAKYQIAKQLKDIENFPEEYVWAGSIYMYLTEKTFYTLRTMFTSAREIQDWFTKCARIISIVCCENVDGSNGLLRWDSLWHNLTVNTRYSGRNTYNETKPKPDAVKQRNAFAPNFIHSLDSTHMMLTSLYCDRADVTFVSVHDCFWTHACTVDHGPWGPWTICREQFVALHTEPILEDLAKFFVKHYRPIYTNLKMEEEAIIKLENNLTNIPKQGSFDINNVLRSIYFFS
ncbi:DNA-directed RNA polymerase, mitochondrial-like [Colletes gigas]|uniref:DNA-directed RNA polymerase, mitochondrial-like n=1 Tax=Colletes gigas TaxID=935657 RepID=UPI001C9AD9D4|nr:DNA-directed RNA polymerase, mitochondrial-like [Colletes gigas]